MEILNSLTGITKRRYTSKKNQVKMENILFRKFDKNKNILFLLVVTLGNNVSSGNCLEKEYVRYYIELA